MSPEIDASSTIAVITLFVFTFIVYRWKKSLLAEHGVGSLMIMYTCMVGLLTGPFFYLFFRGPLGAGSPEAGFPAFVIALGLAGFMDVWEFGKNNGPTINFFLGEKIAEEKFWVVPIMLTPILMLFIGIFALQSYWVYGFYWFAGIMNGVPLLNFLINKGIGGVGSMMRFLREINGMEDSNHL